MAKNRKIRKIVNRKEEEINELIKTEEDEIMVVTAHGITTRQSAAKISRQGRPATGVCVQSLIKNDSVVAVNKIVLKDDDENGEEENL